MIVAATGSAPGTPSRRITRLEAALDIRLLERTTRQLRLTDAGRTFFAHAERAVDDLAQGSDRVHELQKEPRGRVRIMAPIGLGAAVANVVYGYLAKHAGVSIDLEVDERRGELVSEDVDLAIVTGKPDTTDFVARCSPRSSASPSSAPGGSSACSTATRVRPAACSCSTARIARSPPRSGPASITS